MASVFQDLCTSGFALANPDPCKEKGGVVRRPFSKLQAWLIAVSPSRESLSLSAPRSRALRAQTVDGTQSPRGA
jgi:hypothetical protein